MSARSRPPPAPAEIACRVPRGTKTYDPGPAGIVSSPTVKAYWPQVRALAQAAASGRYPNLAAALAAAGPPRSQDDIFASCIDRLIDLAEPGLQRPR
jgi:hypothetical protein